MNDQQSSTQIPKPKQASLIKDDAAAKLLGCSVSTIWRWAKQGTIPKPIRIGCTTRWKLEELEACIAAAEAQRDTAN